MIPLLYIIDFIRMNLVFFTKTLVYDQIPAKPTFPTVSSELCSVQISKRKWSKHKPLPAKHLQFSLVWH